MSDGTVKTVVSPEDAAVLIGYSLHTIREWIREGKLVICYTPTHEQRVFVDSLWMTLPLELRT